MVDDLKDKIYFGIDDFNKNAVKDNMLEELSCEIVEELKNENPEIDRQYYDWSSIAHITVGCELPYKEKAGFISYLRKLFS